MVKEVRQAILLKDGRELRTLSEARALILRMAGRIEHKPFWAYAIELLLKAAETGRRPDVQEAEFQMHRALKAEGYR